LKVSPEACIVPPFKGTGMMLYNLQVLRGIAALGVVFYHTDFRLSGDYHTDFFGVQMFFIISGFIMCFVTREHSHGFFLARVIRVAPLYWFCTALLLGLSYRSHIFRWETWTAITTWSPSSLMIDVPRSLLFLPWDHPPVLGVGWTLNFEMYFYAVFGLALWLNRRAAPLIAATIIIAVTQLSSHGYGGFLSSYYSHFYIYYFIVGIMAFYCWQVVGLIDASNLQALRPGAVFALWATIATCFITPFSMTSWHVYTILIAPAVIVTSILIVERLGSRITWRPLVVLGDASYAIYLSHTILFEQLRVRFESYQWPSPKDSISSVAIYLALSLLTGLALHFAIEKPLTRLIKERYANFRAASQIGRAATA
jgi:exopolysaccharide production protein ExoZ